MSELCPQCGKSIAGAVERCPHCQAELAVTLPGLQVPENEGEGIALPAPKAPPPTAAEPSAAPPPPAPAEAPPPPAAPAEEPPAAEPSLSGIFDDFDPMEEFAPGSKAGTEPVPDLTLGGFDLTPPAADFMAPAGDDVLDFIDTAHEGDSSPGPAEAPAETGSEDPELPSLVTELELMGFEEAAKEAGGPPPVPSVEPPAAEAPPAVPAQPRQSPQASASPPEVAPPAAVPAAAPAALPKARGGTSRHLRLLVGGGILGGLVGLGAYFYLGLDAEHPTVFEEEPMPLPTPKRAAKDEGEGKEAAADVEKAVAEGEAAEVAAEEAVAAGEEGEAGEVVAEGEAGEGEALAAGEEGEGSESEEGEAPAEGEPNFFAEAEALEKEEKWDEALAAYLQAAGPEKGPLDEAHLRRSRIYERRGDLPRALLEARRALAENGERLDARLHLGALFEAMGSLKDARETYEAAIETHPEDPVLLERLARLYLRTGGAWAAVRLLEPRVDGAAPASLRLALGEAYLAASSWSKAEASLRPLARDERAAYPLARALLEQGKTRDALPHLERAAQVESVDPVVHRHLGFVYKELRRRADAARAFRAYLEADPEAVDRREIQDEIASLTR